jgi:hypothetical protein
MQGRYDRNDLGGGRRFDARARTRESHVAQNISEFSAAWLAAGRAEGEGGLEHDQRHASGSEARLAALFERR